MNFDQQGLRYMYPWQTVFLILLFFNHGNDVVPKMIVTMKS